LVERLR
jgi:hypothetical protein